MNGLFGFILSLQRLNVECTLIMKYGARGVLIVYEKQIHMEIREEENIYAFFLTIHPCPGIETVSLLFPY